MAPGGGMTPGGNGGRAVKEIVKAGQGNEGLRTECSRGAAKAGRWAESRWSYEVLRTKTKATWRRTTSTFVSCCDLVDDVLSLVMTEC